MSARIVIADETSTGKVIAELTLELLTPVVTAKQLIELRVRDEVSRFNADGSPDKVFRGLVQPTETEATLNGYELRVSRRKPVDAEAQCERAWHAFESNGFLLLADNRQIEALDETIRITPQLRVSFIKLVPLVGG
jgi:hypothetical protein